MYESTDLECNIEEQKTATPPNEVKELAGELPNLDRQPFKMSTIEKVFTAFKVSMILILLLVFYHGILTRNTTRIIVDT